MQDSEHTDPILRTPGQPGAALSPDVVASLSARYEILQPIARGGMGVVFRARQKALDRQVALKVLLPGASPERFLREARLLAKVRSPHVVAIHDFEVLPDGSPIIVMEWVDGTDLRHRMRLDGGSVPEDDALHFMSGACKGMLAAAEQGIIHRDLKPSNILIDADGQARVVDFGLARGPVLDPEISVTEEVIGTPFYMAPEQWEDPRGIDTRADIYSFGATFYHALTGVTPFRGRSGVSILFSHKTEPLISPRERNRRISEHTSELIERCLAKSAGDRFQTFAEVQGHIESQEEGGRSVWDDPDDPELKPFLERYQARKETYLLRLMTPAEVDTYEFPGRRTIQVIRGDIVDQKVEAIVSSDDGDLSMGDGVAAAIRDAAGPDMVKEARRYAPVRAGRAVVTSGGRLPVRFVFHGITLEFTKDKPSRPSRDLISEIMTSCFYQADALYVERIAFPLLGTGTAGFPEDVCLDTMFRFLARTFLHRVTAVREAKIVLY